MENISHEMDLNFLELRLLKALLKIKIDARYSASMRESEDPKWIGFL